MPAQAAELLQPLYLYLRTTRAMKAFLVSTVEHEFMTGLLVKLFQHAASFYVLSKGTKINNPPLEVDFWDFPSGYVLLRAGIETYAQFRYVFIDSADPDETEFKICVEQIRGLTTRGKMPTQVPEHQAKIIAERQEIARLQGYLRTTKAFQALKNKKDRENALNGRHGLSKTKMVDVAFSKINMSPGYAEAFYGYTSDYAHSGYMSMFQNLQADTSTKQKEHLELGIRSFNALLTSVILDLIVRYPGITSIDRSIVYEVAALVAN